jgi:hypothetical protein
MSPPIWVLELANRFWEATRAPPYPRDLTAAATTALPLRVVRRPALELDGIRAWLARLELPCPTDEPNRPLRACLVMRVGFGFVFLDADDPADELRFSLAHEVAHFLRDYDSLRRTAAARLGRAVLEVLDGKRPATPAERLHAVFRGVPVAAHVHLLRRDDAGRPQSDAEREAEAAADRLAFELLAPADSFPPDGDRAELRARLEATFGLPPAAARAYADILSSAPPPADNFVARLRKSE